MEIKVEKDIVKIGEVNGRKKVKWKCWFENKLIIFIYYLKLFLTLNHIIKLFYQIYLIYFMT